MRESYFTSDVEAILTALEEGGRQTSHGVNRLLDTVQDNLQGLLADEVSAERAWRKEVARSLDVLCRVMRKIGKPTPSVEILVEEMAV